MKIELKRTPERAELLKRMGSDDLAVAREAQQAFAAFIAPVIQTVLLQKATSNAIYRDVEFNENDRPTIPIELYLDATEENFIRVWSQTVPGGLPTNIVQGLNEYTFNVYPLDSAIAFQKSYLKQARLDVLTAGIQRMTNEIAIKQDRNAWAVLLNALAQATTNGSSHIINATQAGTFLPHDLNRLWTKIARMNTSFIGGTPATANGPAGLTDLFVSPEVMEDIRAFAYNPVNTRGGYKSDTTESGEANVPLTDNVRDRIWNSGGLAEIYNVTLHTMVEFGKGQAYNKVFDNFYGGTFDSDTQEILVGVDLSQNVFLRPVVVNDDQQVLSATGGQIVVRPDDQFVTREEKTGFFAKVKEGRVILSDKALTGLIL